MLNSASTRHESLSGGHLAFLRRVTEDNGFRSALEADPQAVMAKYGIQVESGQIPSSVTLPSSEGILDVLNSTDDSDDIDGIREIVWQGFLGS